MTLREPRGPTRVRILLSTHNGQRFLYDQLASVFDQQGVDVHLHIRDDGSTDNSPAIVENYAASEQRLSFEWGDKLGAAQSYLKMLSDASDSDDFVALCDQDDIWLEGKLARALEWLEPIRGPAVYCSAVTVVDERLRPLGLHRTCRRGPALPNALVQNIATGCTIVLNAPAAAYFRQVPRHPVMHDAWIYAVVSAVGNVVYDPEPWVLYRQHDTNSIGLAASPSAQWHRRLRQHLNHGRERVHTRQAGELLAVLGTELSTESRTIITDFVRSQNSFVGRLRYALIGPAFRQRRVDTIVYRFLCAVGRI
ncbi:MAG: glycosyltransferase family 2 protein [Nitrososphaerales archaeon]